MNVSVTQSTTGSSYPIYAWDTWKWIPLLQAGHGFNDVPVPGYDHAHVLAFMGSPEELEAFTEWFRASVKHFESGCLAHYLIRLYLKENRYFLH